MDSVRSRSQHLHYKELRKISLQEDLDNTDSSLPEERKYLKSQIVKINKLRSNYLTDCWNLVDLFTFVVLFVIIVMHTLDVAVHTERLAMWTARVSCLGVLLIWIRLLKLARGFGSLGPLIAIIGQIIADIIKFMILFSIFFIPYGESGDDLKQLINSLL